MSHPTHHFSNGPCLILGPPLVYVCGPKWIRSEFALAKGFEFQNWPVNRGWALEVVVIYHIKWIRVWHISFPAILFSFSQRHIGTTLVEDKLRGWGSGGRILSFPRRKQAVDIPTIRGKSVVKIDAHQASVLFLYLYLLNITQIHGRFLTSACQEFAKNFLVLQKIEIASSIFIRHVVWKTIPEIYRKTERNLF